MRERKGALMLRITIDQGFDSIALRLEGKLIGPWVQELRTVWSRVRTTSTNHVVVSLTEVSTVDTLGRRLLTEIHSAGGVLTGSGLLAKALIEDVTGFAS